jgi:hypothetical protein
VRLFWNDGREAALPMIIVEISRPWTFGLHYGMVSSKPITPGGLLMIAAYPMQGEVFGSACEQFESMVSQLSCEIAGQMEHGQIEALIFKEGTELLRRLMPGHLDLRAIREP